MVKETYTCNDKEYNLREAVDFLRMGKWDSAMKSIMATTGAAQEDCRLIAVAIKNDIAEEKERQKDLKDNILNTSGYNFEGYRITKYVGVENAECALGTGFLSEITAGVMDTVGAESGMFGSKIQQARNVAYGRLVDRVLQRGGNAIIGLDYEYFSLSKNMICVCAKGTSVVVEKE